MLRRETTPFEKVLMTKLVRARPHGNRNYIMTLCAPGPKPPNRKKEVSVAVISKTYFSSLYFAPVASGIVTIDSSYFQLTESYRVNIGTALRQEIFLFYLFHK